MGWNQKQEHMQPTIIYITMWQEMKNILLDERLQPTLDLGVNKFSFWLILSTHSSTLLNSPLMNIPIIHTSNCNLIKYRDINKQ